MTEEASAETAKRPKKSPSPVKFYALVEVKVQEDDRPDHAFLQEIEADKKSDLFAQLESMNEPRVHLLVRGRKVNLSQKVQYKI